MRKNFTYSIIIWGIDFYGVTNVHASTKTDEAMKKISPDLKTAVIKGITPKNMTDSDFLTSGYIGKAIDLDGYYVYGMCDEPEFTTCHFVLQSEDYEGRYDQDLHQEVAVKGEMVKYNITVKYDNPVNNFDVLNNYLKSINVSEMRNSSAWFQVEDLSLINYYLTSDKSELYNKGAAGRAIKYSSKFNKLTEGTGIDYYIDIRCGSQDEGLMYESAFGPMTAFYNDYVYGYQENGFYLKSVIYIPESTKDTKEDYVAAAQERINKYLENDSVVVSYGGLISSLVDYAEDSENPVVSDGNYYNIKVGERTYKFYIIKGSKDKLVEPSYNGKKFRN